MRMTNTEMHRLRWKCRRGLLENDLTLEKFLRLHGEYLEGERLASLNRLLDWDDTDLWDVLSGRHEVEDPSLAGIVQQLRDC